MFGALRRAVPSGYLRYLIRFDGITPLLMSSADMDRDSDLYLSYVQLGQTRKRTQEQDAQLRELEWYTRLYYDEEIGPFIPGKNIKELLRSAATKTRNGEDVKRGLVIPSYRVPLIYEGPRTPKELWDAGFRYTCMVANSGAGSGRVSRTRPCFESWALEVEVAFDQEELAQDRFEHIVKRTEKYGLGDYRPEFGAFTASLEFLGISTEELRVDVHKERNGHEEMAIAGRAEQVMSIK